uniref:Putative secreted protein n=1 Tax=Ixodes scapularis TaxID=6945 RepID=A0A4D5RYM3_IXOSC
MLLVVAILAVGYGSSGEDNERTQASLSSLASQPVAAGVSVDWPTGEQAAAEQASTDSTSAAVSPPGSRRAAALHRCGMTSRVTGDKNKDVHAHSSRGHVPGTIQCQLSIFKGALSLRENSAFSIPSLKKIVL